VQFLSAYMCVDPRKRYLPQAVGAKSEALTEEVEGILGPSRAFCSVTVADTFASGVQNLLLTSGLGPIRPNTVVFSFPSPAEGSAEAPAALVEDWGEAMRVSLALGKTVVSVRGFKDGADFRDSRHSGSPSSLRDSVSTRDSMTLPTSIGGEQIERIVSTIFPAGKPLLDLRVDMAMHGPKAGLKIDVWLLALKPLSVVRASGDPGTRLRLCAHQATINALKCRPRLRSAVRWGWVRLGRMGRVQ
jgi:hypothetical protein